MSTNPPVVVVGGPVTRAQRAAAGGMNPTPPSVGVASSAPVLRPLLSVESPLTVISPDSDEKTDALYDSDATESEAELSAGSYIDEATRLLQDEAHLDAQILEIQTMGIRRRVEAKQLALAAALAELQSGVESSLPAAVGIQAGRPIAVTQVVTETPPRYNLRPRMLAFQSTVGRRAPTAAALQYKAGLDELPDVIPVVVNPPAPKVIVVKEVIPPVVNVVAAPKILIKPVQPEKFTGDDAIQNERVEGWIETVCEWLRLSGVPASEHLEWARSLITSAGGARGWLAQKNDELGHLGKVMTWDWLQGQLIQHYGQPSGAMAMSAEWEVLRMGIRNTDGSESGGKATYTVAAYTDQFLHYMRALTVHSVVTTDLLVINRYVAGIRLGWESLYKVMLGVQRVLWFDSLQEAIEAAYQGEAAISVSKLEKRPSSTSSSSSGSSGAGNSNRFRGRRQTENNNVEDTSRGEGQEGAHVAAAAPSIPSAPGEPTRVYGFVYHGPGPTDGRYPCKEAEQRLLFSRRQCYRCQKVHPVGPGTPRCTAPPCKTAPAQHLN
jgi:hypothetical protein